MNHTLATLLGGHDQIRIPKLQRDFAQGRPGAERIRERFLRALRDALVPAAGGSLDLDFIYGTTNDGAFSPLDGQQRLTTLFLLHWYLAHRDSRVEGFRTLFVDKDGHSRFTYDVRPTAGCPDGGTRPHAPGIDARRRPARARRTRDDARLPRMECRQCDLVRG